MSTSKTIGTTVYQIPQNGESGGSWGEDLHDAIVAIIDRLDLFAGTYDIAVTSFTLTNNQSSAANVTGLSFSASTVRAAEINAVCRISTNTNELTEYFKIYISYENTAGTWNISEQSFGDDCGLTFTITNAGQIQYTSTNVAGTGYSGTLKFTAKTFAQQSYKWHKHLINLNMVYY